MVKLPLYLAPSYYRVQGQGNKLMMIWYNIYLQQLGFHPVAVISTLVQKYESDSYIQKEKQQTKQYKNREYTK